MNRTKGGWRFLAVGGQNVGNLLAPGGALIINIDGTFEVIAVLQVERIKVFRNRHFLRLQVRGHLTKHHHCGVGVLVTHPVACKVAIAFLAPENKESRIIHEQVCTRPGIATVIFERHAFLLKQTLLHGSFIVCHFFTDPFEAGKGVDRLDAVRFCESLLHGRGDKSFDQCNPVAAALRDNSGFLEGGNTVFRQQRTDLVARQENKLPFCVAHRHPHAVGVGVGGEHDLRTSGLRFFHRHLQGLRIFGIG